jgi:hypothetical protein
MGPQSANLKIGKFPSKIEPVFAYRGYVRRRWAQMCPRRQDLQVLPLAFCHYFDLAARQIAYPSGKCEFFGLVIRGKTKADSLHPPADD